MYGSANFIQARGACEQTSLRGVGSWRPGGIAAPGPALGCAGQIEMATFPRTLPASMWRIASGTWSSG